MRRIGSVGALALLTFGLVTPPAGARAAVRCSFDPASAVLRVDARGDALIGIGRGANGDIDVNGNPCGATVFNTDRIRVVGDAGAQSLSICLRCGRLGPGKTHEGTRIDEIEISFEAGHEDDHVQVIGTEHADHLVGSVAGVSLNDDNDVDFWGWGIERVLLAGLGGPDLLAHGYHGTAVAAVVPATMSSWGTSSPSDSGVARGAIGWSVATGRTSSMRAVGRTRYVPGTATTISEWATGRSNGTSSVAQA